MVKKAVSCVFSGKTSSNFPDIFCPAAHFSGKAAQTKFREDCERLCVFVGEIRQVNLPRLERAHLLILLPQITKRELTGPTSVSQQLFFVSIE